MRATVRILTLEWRDIQGDIIRLRPEIAKNKDGRIIILVGEVAKIIDRRRAESVESCPYVFHRQGKQVRDYSRAWGKARKLAGVSHRLFHDVRRTAARNMDRVRVPCSVAKQIIGYKTDAIYNRCRIVDEQDIREGMTLSEHYLANTHGAHLGHS